MSEILDRLSVHNIGAPTALNSVFNRLRPHFQELNRNMSTSHIYRPFANNLKAKIQK